MSASSTLPSTATPSFGSSAPSTISCAPPSIADTLSCDSYVADVYTELILRFARSIKSGAGTLFKARLSPWATGGPGKKTAVEGEEPEVVDTEPKKLEWSMSHELKMAVVRAFSDLAAFQRRGARGSGLSRERSTDLVSIFCTHSAMPRRGFRT